MEIEESVEQLKRFIRKLVSCRIKDRKGWHRWRREKGNAEFMAKCFNYRQQPGMPSITALVQPFFHPSLPLIGLNYTQTAHLTLHRFHDGWTAPMRLCRGMVFSRRAALVAFPFPKFFNFGEQEETKHLPNEPFVATVKQDGHLGIIFWYRGQLIATTRGCFVSASSMIANQMLKALQERWSKVLPKQVTVLAEIIHPDTEVHVDYKGWSGFILIGAFDRRTFHDYDYEELSRLSDKLGIRVTERWLGNSIEELKALMKDLTVKNQEGFVARFQSGLRVKFKFASYVALMIGEKLTFRYAMLHLIEGDFVRKLADMPGEVQLEAQELADKLFAVKGVRGDKKSRWQYLYELVPAEERTDYHRSVCRSFHAWLTRTGQIPAEKTA